MVLGDQGVVEAAEGRLADAQRRLEMLQKTVEANRTDDARLVDTKVRTDELARELLAITVQLRPRLNEIKNRLDQLGEPPAEGQAPEDATVVEQRGKLTAERQKINALTGEAETLSIGATKLSNAITQIRRALFTDRLLEHTDISPSVFAEATAAFSAEMSNFRRTVGSWMNFIWSYKRVPLASAVMLSLAMALVLLATEYRVLGSFIRRDPLAPSPAYTSRLSVAFWSTIMPTMVLAVFLVTTFFFLNAFNVLRRDIAPMVSASFGFVGLVFFVALVSRAILAPSEPNWRLVRVSNRGARSLGLAFLLMAFVNGLDFFLGSISEALSSPVVLTVMKSFISSVIVGGLFVFISFLKPIVAADGDYGKPGRPWPRWIVWCLRLIGLGLVLASVSGYVGLSRFLATQLIVTGAVVATMYIGFLSGREISAPDRFGDTSVGKFVQQRLGLSDVLLDQLGIVAGLLVYLFVLLVGVPLILMSWGFQPRDLEFWAYRLFSEITIGNISISLVGIAGGILFFAVGLVLTRWLQKWLDGNVMARSQVEPGVRNSIKTGVGYLGAAVAALVGVSAAGIDLSSLALVAGALSLGVGFGLQNIVSNFVSGLILLVERPFKVGDWIATGTTEGFVRRISVRATEIETFQRQSLIVPNSELINATVGNWTHRNKLARIDVPIGVSYSSDPRQVIEVLREVGQQQEGVLSNPEPFVVFLGFGASSLDFQLSLFVPDILNSLGVKNGVRVAIFERFKADGIEIPFPQQDVNLFVRGRGSATEPARSAGDTAAGVATAVPSMPEQKAILESGLVPDGGEGGEDVEKGQ